ncbi:hypothetical protein [Hymenobacter sp. DG01]|uniref:hypothetical protein n=1 Tax=Hymenobacter sp. DG01 TaxID=2584940 RepID=UPI001124BA91|nr:hypothetical protein [Hymenobacter sp. DG01]
MSKPLQYVQTAAGIFQLGSQASTTRYEPRTGIVTALRDTGSGPTIELNGRYSDSADYFRLDAGPDPVAHGLLHQHLEGVTSGELEVRLPGENDRIIFCNTPEEVIAVLGRTIGIREVAEEVACLSQALQRGPLDEKRWRGSFGIVGQLAYVSSRRERPAPLFSLKETISAFSPLSTYEVEGILLLCDVYNRRGFGPLGEWHYLVGGQHQPYPIPESNASAITPQLLNH